MTRHPRALARFEEHSLALFAALAMGAAGGAQAQATASTATNGMLYVQAAADGAKPAFQSGPRESIDAVFARADTNRDGKLSREEALRLPAVSERFDEIDADHDRYLSRAEFDKGIAP